mmetsp:Transcript_275/g.618  ORF Transcript_275/g.618 Transcript_275/m.618 type:complete len:218 (-) Transcript_275:1273-1926(-)
MGDTGRESPGIRHDSGPQGGKVSGRMSVTANSSATTPPYIAAKHSPRMDIREAASQTLGRSALVSDGMACSRRLPDIVNPIMMTMILDMMRDQVHICIASCAQHWGPAPSGMLPSAASVSCRALIRTARNSTHSMGANSTVSRAALNTCMVRSSHPPVTAPLRITLLSRITPDTLMITTPSRIARIRKYHRAKLIALPIAGGKGGFVPAASSMVMMA